jgi:hypothetical protein
MSKFRSLFLWVLFCVCWANLLAVFVVAFEIGGDSSRGKMADGHFYVRHQGKFSEVSEPVYRFAQLQMMSIFLTIPISVWIWKRITSDSDHRPE